MQRFIIVLAVLFSPLFLAAGTDDDVQKELKALRGSWKTVAGEAMGTAFPKAPEFTFVVAADGKSTAKIPGAEWEFTMTVNPKKNPKTIENHHTSGPQKGMKQYGIYKLEGDKFTVCIAGPGAADADRPKDFATKDTKNVVFVFERVKADK